MKGIVLNINVQLYKDTLKEWGMGGPPTPPHCGGGGGGGPPPHHTADSPLPAGGVGGGKELLADVQCL